eukprot:GFUD01030980.1.p1 GENE.GFUD01030980.1~~GFUD01030980.1.p1  ORF type:complete len:400 (+),score=104.55 GFUD01030980.1:98-1297(+)
MEQKTGTEPDQLQLGSGVRHLFMLEKGTAFTNHGSYGTVPRQVMEERFSLLRMMDSHPDKWYRNTLRPLYDQAVETVARFVGSAPSNLVFVPNATAAVNTVVKNLNLGPEDIILSNSHTYNACSNAIESAVKRCGADTLSLDITLPIRSEEDFIEQVVEICKRNVGIRLAVIDHISSPSAIVFPVARLAKELHKLGVLLLVDGAHAPGQLPLDLENLGADFYTGNLHKWCYAPRGCAFLWVSPEHRDSIQPLVTSHLYKQDMTDQFFMQGCLDHTPYLCSVPALQFYDQLGGYKNLLKHTQPLLDWAQQMLCHAMGTPVLPVPPDMVAPFMRVLRLPASDKYSLSRAEAERFMDDLSREYGAVAVVTCFSGYLWLRISANAYNCKDDYLELKEVLLKCL